MAEYSSDKRVIDDYWDEYPNLTETEVRNCLSAFLFTGEEVFKNVNMLSGGERVRLALAKIFKQKPNVLILDEPTNHMDIVGKETLESMLKDFAGTVKKVSDVILEMKEDGSKLWQFGYDDYMEKSAKAEATDTGRTFNESNANLKTPVEAPTSAMNSYQAGKELSRNRKKIAKIEEEIEKLEALINELKDSLNDETIASSYMKLSKVQEEIDANEEQLNTEKSLSDMSF